MLRVNALVGFGSALAVMATGAQPVMNPSDKSAQVTLSNSDRTYALAGTQNGYGRGLNAINGQKRFVEAVIDSGTMDAQWRFGIATTADANTVALGSRAAHWCVQASGNKINNNSSSACIGSAFTIGDTIMLAFDGAAVWFGKNGTWVGDPGAGTGAAFTGISGDLYLAGGGTNNNSSIKGATLTLIASYLYPAPSGFLKGW